MQETVLLNGVLSVMMPGVQVDGTANFAYVDSDLMPINASILVDTRSLVDQDPRARRNFDQLIEDRGSLNTNYYNCVFEKIKEKLFTLIEPEVPLTNEEVNVYSEKHNSKVFSENISKFKETIAEMYQKKLEINSKIENAKESYNSFLTDISSFLHKIEESELLKEHLNLEIEKYYLKLDIPNLMKESAEINKEFEFLRKTLSEFSKICPPTICTVCYDRQVSWFIDPCGHTICTECKDKCQLKSDCHMCRMKRNNYKRLFL
jgi:hypothetical protein